MAHTSIWAATDLILDNTRYGEDEKILIMRADSIDLIEAVARAARSVSVHDSSFQNLKRLRSALRRSNIVIADTPYPAAGQTYDSALLFVSKGREFSRAALWAAAHAVKSGGEIYITGPTDGGAKTMIKDAETLLGSCNTLAYKKSHRIAVGMVPPQIMLPDGWNHPSAGHTIAVTTPFGSIEVVTVPGVFSWEELDEGTRFLIDHISIQASDSVLDLGCGNGIIGTSLAAHVQHVTLTDDNLLAVDCARQTIQHNHITNAAAFASDVYSELTDQRYDLIVCNPPFHQQFDVTTQITGRIIREAPDHLNRNGRLLLVANAFLKYEQDFREVFRQTRIVAQNNRYKIIEGVV